MYRSGREDKIEMRDKGRKREGEALSKVREIKEARKKTERE